MGAAESAMIDAVVGAAQSRDINDLAGSPLRHLARAVNASGSLLYRYSKTNHLDTLGGVLKGPMLAYHPQLMAEDPTQLIHRGLDRGPKVIPASAMAGQSALRRSSTYSLVYRPTDIEHIVCICLEAHCRYLGRQDKSLRCRRSRQ